MRRELQEAIVTAKGMKEHKGESKARRQPESLPAGSIGQEIVRRNSSLCPFVPFVVNGVCYRSTKPRTDLHSLDNEV